MARFGVTNAGFVQKTYDDIVDEMEDRLISLFGSDVDLSPGSPIKLISDLFNIELAKLWIELKSTYESGFIDTATGASLNSLGAMVGINREAGTSSTGNITFFRSEVLPSGSARLIPINTFVQTTDEYPKTYYTTESVYFRPIIQNEISAVAADTDITQFSTENIVGEIVTIKDQFNTEYQAGASFDGRVIDTAITIPSGSTIYTTYKPLSVSAGIKSVVASSISNTNPNTITVMTTPVSFVHYIANESALTNGTAQELDAVLRARIKNATQAIGKATLNALNTSIRDIDGVTNVIVRDIVLDPTTYSFTATETTNVIDLGEIVINSVQSVTGSVSGELAVTSFWIPNGTIVLESDYQSGEDITVEYVAENMNPVRGAGVIKIFVAGGDIDAIVSTIEDTRAAGIKSIGMSTDNPLAQGSETYPFSWFYRLEDALIDIGATIYFYDDSELTPSERTEVLTDIQTSITTFINQLEPEDKLWKSKITQLCMESSEDIENVSITRFTLNDLTGTDYLMSSEIQMPTADSITIIEG